MKNIVLIGCNNKYVPKAIIALKQFSSYNPNYKKVIIGTTFSTEMKNLCKSYQIELFEIDLSKDFIHLDKRPYGKEYPIECFYHLYGYKLFPTFDFLIHIEPDIYTNKKLNINFQQIPYIGGGYSIGKGISNYRALMNDYPNIKKVFGMGNLRQHRILGGVKVYNIKGLLKIKFYEKMVHYYQKSIQIKSPRCGDDSLCVMYQMLNSSHIKLLPSDFNITYVSKDINIKNVTFFHFAKKGTKYWQVKDINKLHSTYRYFYDNNLEFIYNRFPLSFIKNYIPEIYIPIENIKIPFYYYSKKNNFGDLITPYFLDKFSKKEEYTYNLTESGPKVLSTGSIMRLCHPKTLVYGSGIRDIKQNIKPGHIQFVRGPRTRKRFQEIGCYCPPNYGDPGLLLPSYYKPTVRKTYKLGIIPHIVHYSKIVRMYQNSPDIKVINLLHKDIEFVIREILSCEKVVSSSLHGLIISDAYSIPNKWVQFSNEIEGDNTKFLDYFDSVQRKDKIPINCMIYRKIPENTFSLIQNVSISFDKNYLEKKFFLNKNGIKPYTKYLYKKYCL